MVRYKLEDMTLITYGPRISIWRHTTQRFIVLSSVVVNDDCILAEHECDFANNDTAQLESFIMHTKASRS